MIQNSAGNDPYVFICPWCNALIGCMCTDEKGNEYTDGSYHRARLMKDCLEMKNIDKYQEMCRIAREKHAMEPDIDEIALCEYCIAQYDCEV